MNFLAQFAVSFYLAVNSLFGISVGPTALFDDYIKTNYSRDTHNIYFDDQIIEEADLESFGVLHHDYYLDSSTGMASNGYAKDANHIYFNGEVVNEADLATFETADDSNSSVDAQDRNHKYFRGEIVNNPIPLLDSMGNESVFAKDDNHVYFYDTVEDKVTGIAKPDAASAGAAYGREVDYETFQVLNLAYSQDKNYVYFGTDMYFTTVQNADLESFVASSTNIWAAEDKNHKYLNGEIVE